MRTWGTRPSLAQRRSVLGLTPSARAAADTDSHGPSGLRARPLIRVTVVGGPGSFERRSQPAAHAVGVAGGDPDRHAIEGALDGPPLGGVLREARRQHPVHRAP